MHIDITDNINTNVTKLQILHLLINETHQPYVCDLHTTKECDILLMHEQNKLFSVDLKVKSRFSVEINTKCILVSKGLLLSPKSSVDLKVKILS